MLPPKCFFNSDLPRWWSKDVLKSSSSYDAMTVPTTKGKPAIIFFEAAKEDVPEKLAAEEYCHAQQADKMGPAIWYVTYELQRKQFGYKKAPLEIEAKAAGKRGLDTPEKKAWWAAA